MSKMRRKRKAALPRAPHHFTLHQFFKMEKKDKILIALGVGVTAYWVLYGQKKNTPPQVPQYPQIPLPQNQKGKGWRTAADVAMFLGNMATSFFGAGAPFGPKK